MSTASNPDFVCIDYHVSGRRTAVDVHLGRSQLVGISLADSSGRCAFFTGNFQSVISSLAIRRRVYHDAVFAQAVECKYGLTRSILRVECTRTMGHLLDENAVHDFDHLIHQYGHDLAAFGPVQVYGAMPTTQFAPLNSACLPGLLYVRGEQSRRLVAEQLCFVYDQVELPLVEPLVAMSQTGIRVDVERLECISESHQTQCGIIRHQLEQVAGRPVELGSSEDVTRLLFEQLRLPVMATSPSGAPSTDQEALEPLRGYHPAVDLVMRGRHLQTVASAAKSLLDHADMGTGRVYPCLDPLGTVTGRLSCSSPNLQALPAALLEAIVADEGYVLAEMDFSQMELRVLANLSQDRALCEAFIRDEDIHQTTAAKLFGLALECTTPEQRQVGKRVNFGIVYGQTALGLAPKLRVSVQQAEAWIAGFYRGYPLRHRYQKSCRSWRVCHDVFRSPSPASACAWCRCRVGAPARPAAGRQFCRAGNSSRSKQAGFGPDLPQPASARSRFIQYP